MTEVADPNRRRLCRVDETPQGGPDRVPVPVGKRQEVTGAALPTLSAQLSSAQRSASCGSAARTDRFSSSSDDSGPKILLI
jgi:hypothetical protein